MLQTVVYSDADEISTDLISRKTSKVYGTSSDESNWVGYPIYYNSKGGSHEYLDISGEILKCSLQTRGLLWGITGEFLGVYWVINIICL